MVGARLEGDIERPSPGPFTRLIERDDLGVGRAGALVPSLADDIPLVVHDDRTHHGIGGGLSEGPIRQGQGCLHQCDFVWLVQENAPATFASRARERGRLHEKTGLLHESPGVFHEKQPRGQSKSTGREYLLPSGLYRRLWNLTRSCPSTTSSWAFASSYEASPPVGNCTPSRSKIGSLTRAHPAPKV